ncbi:hypothetical protein GT347_17430 [Xylophilus rhododendri]|uniref:Uncharacterized protein n=1 Tax=Xylophilus rhododendri TaxID=2697032 RepID=A0A857JA21_9BURK|nr:hypothetical protein [Xylophilus rhododendri]QHI99598.1 hypothetical protein GT347_17430 [Xylophilus rhododendri]
MPPFHQPPLPGPMGYPPGPQVLQNLANVPMGPALPTAYGAPPVPGCFRPPQQQAQPFVQGFAVPWWAGAVQGQPGQIPAQIPAQAPVSFAPPSHEQARQQFEAAIQAAQERYAGAVNFEEVLHEDGRRIGYCVSAESDEASLKDGKRPIVLVAGTGQIDPQRSHVLFNTRVLSVCARGPDAAEDFVRQARELPAHESLRPGPLDYGPNLQLCSSAITPDQAACVLDADGPKERQPVRIFLPVPDLAVHISALQRRLKPAAGAIAYLRFPSTR